MLDKEKDILIIPPTDSNPHPKLLNLKFYILYQYLKINYYKA